uniref:Uncharacterized protein n=1 Tax=Romanomermis culicivorax TaxID=13658 RepID=A0A915JUG7_ROMCU
METNPLNSIILDRRIDIPITKHFEQNSVNDFHKDFFTSDAQSLKSMVDFTIPHWSIGQFPHNDPIAKAALSQGFIFKTISDRYHNILRQSPLPIVSYRNGALSMCLPENRLHDSYALFTFPPKRTAGYHLLLAVRRKDITIHEMNIRMMNENRKIDERFVKLSLEHIFEDMSNDILFTSREQDVARSVLAPGQVDPSHLMSIAYNAETDKVAIIGLDQETQRFTTDDVLKICTSGRRKRNRFSVCSSITSQDQAEYNKDDDSFKIGDEQVKKMITTKNDKLKAQLEKRFNW